MWCNGCVDRHDCGRLHGVRKEKEKLYLIGPPIYSIRFALFKWASFVRPWLTRQHDMRCNMISHSQSPVHMYSRSHTHTRVELWDLLFLTPTETTVCDMHASLSYVPSQVLLEKCKVARVADVYE